MAISTGSLIAAAALAAGGAIGGAINRSDAKNERTRMYNESLDFLNSEYYRDPLSSTSNKALLKNLDQRMERQNEAMENRAAAGGATIENQLAARKANNETMSNVFSNLLMGEDARRQAINNQKFQLGQNYSQGVQMDYRQAAQDWQSWGAMGAQAALQFGSSYLLKK